MAFDVTQFELDDTAILEVQDASGTEDLMVDGQPVTIVVYGPGSKQGVRAMNIGARNSAMRMAGALRGKVSKTAVTEAEEEAVEKLVMITAAINNFPIEGGAQALYSNTRLRYIADQVDTFFNNKANFLKKSPTVSSSTSGS